MTDIKNTIDTFVRKWNKNDTLKNAAAEEISGVEDELGIRLPKSYLYLTGTYGDVWAPDLLDFIVDNEIETNDVQSFSLPSEALNATNDYERAGMPEGYLAFASDCMGNMFCFKLAECIDEYSEPPVWFFDHDFSEMEKAAESFQEWLEFYNRL